MIKEIAMTEATPQTADLIAEIERLRAQVAKARAIVEYMNEDDPVSVAWSDLYDLRDVLKG